MGYIEGEEPKPSRIITRPLSLVRPSSERLVYRRTALKAKSNERLQDVVVTEFTDAVTWQQVSDFKDVTNAAEARMRENPRRGYLGTTIVSRGSGIPFRWAIVPIDRVEATRSGSKAISEYKSGLEVAELYSLRGEMLQRRIGTLSSDKQEVLRWLAEDVFSQEEERRLLEENMDKTSAYLNEQLGVTGIKLTPNHTRVRLFLPDDLPIVVLLEATHIVENSITAIQRLPKQPELEGQPKPFREPIGDI